jgi:hypothetical protein
MSFSFSQLLYDQPNPSALVDATGVSRFAWRLAETFSSSQQQMKVGITHGFHFRRNLRVPAFSI